jgi:hypothetical protein
LLFLYDTNIRKYFPQFLNHSFPELRIVAQLVDAHKLSNRKNTVSPSSRKQLPRLSIFTIGLFCDISASQLVAFLSSRTCLSSTLRLPSSFITMRSLNIKLPEPENAAAKLDQQKLDQYLRKISQHVEQRPPPPL